MPLLRSLLATAVLVLCSSADATDTRGQASDGIVRVSLIRLIASPAAYDGKLVSVSGFAFIEFENNNLCIVRKPSSSHDCVWINYFDGPVETDADMERYQAAREKWSKFNRRHISLRGTFDASDSGHLGGSSGGIGHITDVSVLDSKRK